MNYLLLGLIPAILIVTWLGFRNAPVEPAQQRLNRGAVPTVTQTQAVPKTPANEIGSSAGASVINGSDPVSWKTPPSVPAPTHAIHPSRPSASIPPAKPSQTSSTIQSGILLPAVSSGLPAISSSSFAAQNHPVTGSGGVANSVPPSGEWVVDSGLVLPAALVEGDQPASPVTAAITEQIVQKFEQEIINASTTLPNGENEITDEAWSQAKANADDLYKIMYGDAAFSQRGMKAAVEATAP